MHAWLTRIEVLIAIVAFSLIAVLTVPRGVEAAISPQLDPAKAAHDCLQNAIDRYAMEHHDWPGQSANCEELLNQLTQFTDLQGNTSATFDQNHRFGPYLQTGSDAALLLEAVLVEPSLPGQRWEYNPNNGRLQLSDSDRP